MALDSATLKDSTFASYASSLIEGVDPRKSTIHKQEALGEHSTEVSSRWSVTTTSEITSEKDPPHRVAGLVPRQVKLRPRSRFKLLQKWEGTVIEVEGDVIRAQIRDLSNRSRFLEEVTLSIDEVSNSDRSLVASGAVFYWMIGYLDRLTGQRTRESRIIFRRLPVWKKSEFDVIDQKARPLAELLPDEEVQALRKRLGSL
jgi:hypothetical protein